MPLRLDRFLKFNSVAQELGATFFNRVGVEFS